MKVLIIGGIVFVLAATFAATICGLVYYNSQRSETFYSMDISIGKNGEDDILLSHDEETIISDQSESTWFSKFSGLFGY